MSLRHTNPQPRKAPKGSKITCAECRKTVLFRSTYYSVPMANGTRNFLCHRCQHDWYIIRNAEDRAGQTRPIAYGSLQTRISEDASSGTLSFYRKSHKCLAQRWKIDLPRSRAVSRSDAAANTSSFPLTAQAARQLRLIVPRAPCRLPDQGELRWLQQFLNILLTLENNDDSVNVHWGRIVSEQHGAYDPDAPAPRCYADLDGWIAWLASYLEQVATPSHIHVEEASYA